MVRINARRQRSHGTSTLASQDHLDPAFVYLQKEFKKTQTRLDICLRKLRNKAREARRAKASRKITQDENRRVARARRMQIRRAATQHECAIKKAVRAAHAVPGEVYLKDKGVIKDTAREMIRKLACFSVPEEKMNGVIHAVAEGFELRVVDSVSTRTVSRIVHEGGIAAELQLVSEFESARGLTLSGDGTTIRHRNYESRHATLQVPSYTEEDGGRKFKTRFLGAMSAANHTAEMQFQGLKNQVTGMYSTYNASPMGHIAPADIFRFATYILGLGTDHAEDQKKLARLILEWKVVVDLALRGQQFMTAMAPSELLPVILEACDEKIKAAGGFAAWEALPEDEKERRDKEVYDGLCHRFGEKEWEKLLEEEKREARLFVWAGCCMHKEMNSVKGGVRAMTEFWKTAEVDGPIKLMNRDNAATAAAGPSKARDQALEVSEGGAVKLTSLAGAIFKHKDDKKGQQDTFRIYFESRLTYPIHFPDTSNTRFGCHCEAAAELIVHLPYYLEFLLVVKDCKDKRNFNHMEKNVFNGLTDIPTLTELCVLALYAQSISHPYMCSVRGSGDEEINSLDLGPLHKKVKAHCIKIIDNPALLLAADASHTTGTLDRKLWQRPEAFYAVHRMAPTLPHLEPCLVAFFRGALKTWDRFTSEFEEDGAIHGLSDAAKSRIHIAATNDHNEGALGSLRVAMRAAPNLSLRKFNSKMMYKKNGTRTFVDMECTPADKKFIRKEARERDEAGSERANRREEATHIRRVVEEKRLKDTIRKEKIDARERMLNKLRPELDIRCLKEGKKSSGEKLTVAQIREQINWHRRYDDTILSKTLIASMVRSDALTQLIVTVTRFNSTPRTASQLDRPASPHRNPEPMDWEDIEDRNDADMLDID